MNAGSGACEVPVSVAMTMTAMVKVELAGVECANASERKAEITAVLRSALCTSWAVGS
jgi:DNA-binding transcriptional regulator WhiA